MSNKGVYKVKGLQSFAFKETAGENQNPSNKPLATRFDARQLCENFGE